MFSSAGIKIQYPNAHRTAATVEGVSLVLSPARGFLVENKNIHGKDPMAVSKWKNAKNGMAYEKRFKYFVFMLRKGSKRNELGRDRESIYL